MSGKPWTPERKAAYSVRMRKRWRDPKYRKARAEQSRAIATDPEKRATASERMKRLNERMRSDPALKKKCVAGQKRARRKPGYRNMQSLTMRETMAKPENRETARQHARRINRDPKVRARQWDGRRRKQKEAKRKAAEAIGRFVLLAPPRPKIAGDPNTIMLQLLAREAARGDQP